MSGGYPSVRAFKRGYTDAVNKTPWENAPHRAADCTWAECSGRCAAYWDGFNAALRDKIRRLMEEQA